MIRSGAVGHREKDDAGEGELVGIGLMDWIEKGVEFAEAGEVGDKVMMIAHSFV